MPFVTEVGFEPTFTTSVYGRGAHSLIVVLPLKLPGCFVAMAGFEPAINPAIGVCVPFHHIAL